MRISNQPQLPRVGRILRARIPSDALSIGFCNQKIRLFQRASEIISQPDATPIQSSLRLEIGIFRHNVQRPCDGPLVDVGMDTAAKILGDELVGAFVFIDDLCLPPQELGYYIVLKILPLKLIPRVQNSVWRGEVLPFVHELSPVGKSPILVDCVRRLVFFFQTPKKFRLHVSAARPRWPGFIVDLIADNHGVIFEMADDFANHPLGSLAKVRVEKIIILSWTIATWRQRRWVSRLIRIA